MQQAIVRHENQQACVIPIILRPTYWEQTPFAKLQALPTEGKPISTWRFPDEAWKNVVQGIQKAILEREKNATMSPSVPVRLINFASNIVTNSSINGKHWTSRESSIATPITLLAYPFSMFLSFLMYLSDYLSTKH